MRTFVEIRGGSLVLVSVSEWDLESQRFAGQMGANFRIGAAGYLSFPLWATLLIGRCWALRLVRGPWGRHLDDPTRL